MCGRRTRRRYGQRSLEHLRLQHCEKVSTACYDLAQSLGETKQNRDVMHCPTTKSGNHPFRSAARIVQRQFREDLENRPWRGFAHVGVELGVSAQSAGHRRTNASVAEPRIQRNRCGVFSLNIKCNWDGLPCRRARVNVAINKGRACQHSPR